MKIKIKRKEKKDPSVKDNYSKEKSPRINVVKCQMEHFMENLLKTALLFSRTILNPKKNWDFFIAQPCYNLIKRPS